jgi:hypothetical protein
MHPIGPQMFFAAGLVIAEDARRKHDRSIGQTRVPTFPNAACAPTKILGVVLGRTRRRIDRSC